MASGIYKITDKRNNKIYIGRAADLKNRKWRHFCYTHPEDYLESSLSTEINMDIHKAMMDSHNAEDFLFEVLEECEEDKLNEREQYYIQIFDCMIPKGYNKTKGGESYPHSKGEEHYNHKITLEEANKIKDMLRNKKSVEEIIKKIPQATTGIISHINNGRTWKDPNLNYPICRLSGLIKFDNETVMEIRRRREEGETTTSLAEFYNTGTSTISSICNGDTHKDLPILIEKRKIRNTFTKEQVLFYREQYYINNISIKTLYEQSPFYNIISYGGFKDMVNGSSYKQYKTYKEEKIEKENNKKEILIDRNKLIRQLTAQGITKQDIANQIGCSVRTVYRAINKENKFE